MIRDTRQGALKNHSQNTFINKRPSVMTGGAPSDNITK